MSHLLEPLPLKFTGFGLGEVWCSMIHTITGGKLSLLMKNPERFNPSDS